VYNTLYKNVNLPAVVHGYEIRFFTVNEEERLRFIENKMMK